MIKEIKSFLGKNSDGTTTINTSVTTTIIDYYALENIMREVVKRVADEFLRENEELIKRDILDNPKFADAVYNAIVLKKAGKELI